MISYAKTDTGLVRRSNQDFLFAADQPVGPLPNLFIVANGMGGHKSGQSCDDPQKSSGEDESGAL